MSRRFLRQTVSLGVSYTLGTFNDNFFKQAILLLAVQKWLKPFRLNPVNYFVDFIPVNLNPLHILLVDAAAFVLMLLIMIIPSLFIARVSPDRTIKVS